MKKCIYFTLTGDYDNLKEPLVTTPGWDYTCFTNNKKLKSKNWQIVYIESGMSDARLSRMPLVLNHKFVGEYDLSILIGAQMEVRCDLDIFVDKFLPADEKIDISMPAHPNRTCIYKEATKCIGAKKDDPKLIQKQMDFYRSEGYPENNGLCATGITIRRHNRPNLEEHCEKWWEQIKTYSFRDQLSFNYVLWKYKLINVDHFSYDIVRNKGNYFKKYGHRRHK